jgi:hypothetical protein
VINVVSSMLARAVSISTSSIHYYLKQQLKLTPGLKVRIGLRNNKGQHKVPHSHQQLDEKAVEAACLVCNHCIRTALPGFRTKFRFLQT